MAELELPKPAIWNRINLNKVGKKVHTLTMIDCRLLFYEFRPIACYYHGFAYFPDTGLKPVEMAEINKFSRATIRVEPSEFDFVVGQAMILAGLPLTRRPKESSDD